MNISGPIFFISERHKQPIKFGDAPDDGDKNDESEVGDTSGDDVMSMKLLPAVGGETASVVS